MSYLNRLRLHFAGRFQAAPSTVNNSAQNFNTKKYVPGPNDEWNPRGDAAFRLIGCRVTGAWMGNGASADAGDTVLTYLVADSDRRTTAKMVDLDPEQQLVSMIFGLEVRICDTDGNNLLRGRFQPAPFMDLWNQAVNSAGGDSDLGSGYQSVLKDLEWGDLSHSPFLQALRAAAMDGLLSIKFNVDGYGMDPASAEFTRGRVIGTIGPASASEPSYFVAGRRLAAQNNGKLNFCTAVVDEVAGKILIDLGNALPTQSLGGPLADIGSLTMVCGTGADQFMIGQVPYTQSGWYDATAGVVELPAGRALTSAELAKIAVNPLSLVLTGASGAPTVAVTEPPNGVYVRADQFVYRLDSGAAADVRIYATRYGRPYPGCKVALQADPSQLQMNPGDPRVATPADGIAFPAEAVAGPDGIATLSITAGHLNSPRGYIDGQVYGVRPLPAEAGADYPVDPWEFISLLVWNAYTVPETPRWYPDLQPVFQQYANLYPIMKDFLDLGSYDSVCANQHLLLLAFGLDASDPNAMPVTRDLSSAKRDTILRWLRSPGPDGKPLLGTPPAVKPAAHGAPKPPEPAPKLPHKGGKAAAISRRLALQ